MNYTVRNIEITHETSNQKVKFSHRRGVHFYVTISTPKKGYSEVYTESYTVERANNLFKTLMNTGSWKVTFEQVF